MCVCKCVRVCICNTIVNENFNKYRTIFYANNRPTYSMSLYVYVQYNITIKVILTL